MADLFYSLSVTGDCSNISNGAINISINGGTPPYNVLWDTPNLGYDLAIYSSYRDSLSYGTYSVIISDSSLLTNNQILVNIPISNGLCCYASGVQGTTCGLNNGIVTGTSSSDYSITTYYLFDSGSTLIVSANTSTNIVLFEYLTAGTYYMVAQDVGGCTGRSETFIIEESIDFDFGLYVVPNASCGYTPLGKIYVTGQTGISPYTYIWNNGETTSSITGLTAGEYSVSVTDSLNCSQTKNVTIIDIEPLSVVLFTANPPSCLSNDGSLTLTLTGGTVPFYYSASTGYVEISYSRNFTLSGIGAGVYSFLITDAAFCSTSVGTTLNSPSGMTSINVVSENSNCSNIAGSIGVSLVGGNSPYSYTLIYPDSSSKNVVSSFQFNLYSDLSSGTYTLVVEDASGCTFMNDYTLITEDKFTISTQTTGTTFGQDNGVIEVIKTSGGTPPYNYFLDGNIGIVGTTLSATTFYKVSSGQHGISVSDANGCVQTSQVYVDYFAPVDFLLYPTSAGIGSDGTITALISSGTPPFTFNWSNNVDGNPQTIFVDGLTAGTYSLTIIDGNKSSLNRTTTIEGSKNIVSYQTFIMGEQTFQIESSSKYSLSKMLNEGYFDITSGHTDCGLMSATFTTKVNANPYGIEITDTFFTTTSLLVSPDDNLWYDSIKTLLMSIIGIGDVIIDETNNQITIINDRNVDITVLDIKVSLVIEYDINCTL